MLYVLIPHSSGTTWEACRLFTAYSAAEQAALCAARDFARMGMNWDWCSIIAYTQGIDELHAVFLYTLIDPTRLQRERLLTPSP